MRDPVAAGIFYNSEKEELEWEIRDCFLHKFGVGELPQKNGKNVIASIVPHASYFYSGPAASFSYYYISKSPYRRFLIIGINHYCIGEKVALSKENWLTPLGIAKIDEGLLKIFSKHFKIDERAHKDHSIEVQLPFLQFLFKDKFTFLPLSVYGLSYEEIVSIAKIIKSNLPKDVSIIVSSDFTHYGFNYGYMPFNGNAKEKVYMDDLESIKLILRLKGKEFYERALSRTICNFYGITLLLEILKGTNVEGKLLKYYTSNDIRPSNNFVGYASIIFEKIKEKVNLPFN